MILTILAIIAVSALVPFCWKHILAFLNGPVRNLLERVFGADRCSWYVKFLQWADKKMTVTHRILKMQWKKFRDTVLRVNSKYTKNENGTYTKTSESLVRTSPETGKRIVVEETIGWEYLPDSVREEMIRLRSKEAELDDKAVAEEKFRQRAEEDGIELSA